MEINYTISPYPSLTEAMVAKVYETQSPNAEVDSITLPTPHNFPRNISFTGLDFVPHIVRLFTASGTLLHQYDVQPTLDVVTIFDPIFFKIGDGQPNTPAANTGSYVNADLIGLTNADLLVHRDGALKFPGIHYEVNTTSGGFDLLQDGDVFETDAEYIIQRKPQAITTPVNDSVVGKQFGGFVDVVNTTVNYEPAHLRKLIRLSGANGKYYFLSGTAIPIGYVFRFSNFGPYSVASDTPTIYFNNAPLLMGNGVVTEFILPYKAVAEFTFDGTAWNCTLNNVPVEQTNVGKITFMGTYLVGNVALVNDLRTIAIPNQGTGNYWVFGTLLSQNDNPDVDNDVFFITARHSPTQFE